MTELESRAAVPLRTLPAVELAAVGTWRAQTGETTFTHEDLAGAIAALDCPGIRNPVLKLGHSEDDSTGGVRWDGEPAVGWVANLRMSENGTKLIGDYTGVPEWLAEVMPSAYPDRSIEIYRPLRCQIGHYHPSVITAVALLGVMPPGVGVLQSLQDVYAAFTVTDQQGDRAEASAPVRVLMPVRLAAARGPLVLRRNPSDVEKAAAFDPGAVQDAWTDELEELIADWQAEVDPDARADLLDQIEEQMASEDGISTLAEVAVGAAVVTAGAALLAAAMLSAGETAADLMLAEMQAQGLPPVAPADLDDEWLRERAAGTARTLLAGLATSAGRRALSLADPDATPGSVRDGVAEHLESLTDRALRDQLGAALTAAQNAGRITVLVNAPPARYVSSEIVDANACTACVAVDGTEFDSLAAAKAAYLSGGYVGCLGRDRCRGMVVAVWGDVPARAAAPDARGRGMLPSLVQIRYGDQVVVVRLAYNPDQPRDKIGRWGKGVAGHPDFEGMTDTEFDARAASVSEHVGGARKTLSTDVTHTNDVGAWTAERDRLHREIVDDLYERDSHVPNDGRAVIAGGLGGAGKTTVLTKHAGVDTSSYMTVNPDDIKEELARRGMIPAVPDAPDLSPMERATLVHEESSRIASMLADRAYREKRNIIWDITMSSESSVKSRVAALQKAGYGEINGVFVDIPVETSVERAMARYRRGVDQYLGGKGFGGRYVPPEIIRAQETSSGMTLNRQVFDGLREQFTESSVYDNSVTGKPPRKVG